MHPYRVRDPSIGPQGHFIALMGGSGTPTGPEEEVRPPPPRAPSWWGQVPLQSPRDGVRSPRPPRGVSGTEEEPLVPLVHLLEKDEGEHGVGAQAGVVGGEALPEAEEALIPHHLQQHVLWEEQGVRGGPKNNEKPP